MNDAQPLTPATPSARRGVSALTLGLVVLLLAAAGAFYAYTVYSQPDPTPPDELTALKSYLAHLGRTFATALPPGVTVNESDSKTLLGAKDTAGKIVLQAAADAPPCQKVPIAVLGHVSINFVVKIGYASEVIWVSVKK